MIKTLFAFTFTALALAGCSKDETLVNTGSGHRMGRLSITETPGDATVSGVGIRLWANGEQFDATTDNQGVAQFANLGRTHTDFSVVVVDDCYQEASAYTWQGATDLDMLIGAVQVKRMGNLKLVNGSSKVYMIWLNGSFEGYLGPGAYIERYRVPNSMSFIAEEDTWFFPAQFEYSVMVTHCRQHWITTHTFY
jgi:hypothetical protein